MSNAASAVSDLLSAALKHDQEVQKQRRLKERGSLEKLNPSASDAGKCPREVWYSLQNVEPSDPITEDSLLNFAVGHAAEVAFGQKVAAYLESKGEGWVLLEEQRVEIGVTFPVSAKGPDQDGRLDLEVFQSKVTGRLDFAILVPHLKVIVELKTIGSRAMSFMLKNGERGRDGHRRQLGIYLYAAAKGLALDDYFGFEQKPDGVIVYITKDATKGMQSIHAFDVPLDVAAVEKDLEELARVHHFAATGVDVPRPAGYSPKKYPCGWCSYQALCWSS